MGEPGQTALETPHADAARHLLTLVEDLVIDLQPHRRGHLKLDLGSSLDRDLAIDSLGLAELLTRIESTFQVRLADDLLAKAETVGDLLSAIDPNAVSVPAISAEALRPTPQQTPEIGGATTLTELLDRHARDHPESPHILFYDQTGSQLTYNDLAQGARSVAAGLLKGGLVPGDRVALMLPTGPDFFLAFFGTLYAGGIPVPIYPPLRMSQIEEHLRRQAGILNNAGAAALITVSEALRVGKLLRGQVTSLRILETVEQLSKSPVYGLPAPPEPEGIAFLQYTSGSTGDPKGVVITHANLLANLAATRNVFQPEPSDVIVSWLPLYHDMGLIGGWFASLVYSIPAVIMSPLTFLTRPQEWLWAIHRHRGTYSGGPNFGFELCLRKIPDEAIEGLDLSSLKHMMNGAEPVSASTIRRFTERFSKYGFRPEVMKPVYGMAENTLGLSVPTGGRLPVIDRIHRRKLARRGEAVPVEPDHPHAVEVVGCGPVLKGHRARIVDPDGRELGERREGRLQFRGPSATSGYFRNEEKTSELKDGDWLESGDRAYLAHGEVFVTGRSKDLIIRAGRNIHPHELELAVGDIAGIRKGCVAAFGVTDTALGTEKIVIVAETREADPAVRSKLEDRVSRAAAQFLEAPPEEVHLAPPHSIPKTSSGKLRRAAMKENYQSGLTGGRHRALWRQLSWLSVTAFLRGVQRGIRSGFVVLYGVYWWLVSAPLLLGACLWAMVCPRKAWRRAGIRVVSRVVLWLTATPLTVSGREQIPHGGAVMVCNHTSYFDVVVLAAALRRLDGVRCEERVSIPVVCGPLSQAYRFDLRRALGRGGKRRRHPQDYRLATPRGARVLFPGRDLCSHARSAALPRRCVCRGGRSAGAGRADQP